MAYNYLHEDAFDGSLLPLPTLHKAVWAYIVAKAKPDNKAVGGGSVWLVPRLMAVYFPDVSITDIESVIRCFCEPDPNTRTELHEGRKLIPMGRDKYGVPTYSTHAGSRLARDAERKRRERESQSSQSWRSTPLIPSQKQLERLRETHAFIGSRLRVPNALHEELRNKVGVDGEQRLQKWYLDVDAEVELSGEAIPDIFDWLRPRFVNWCNASGYAKTVIKKRPTPERPNRDAIKRKLDAEFASKHQAARR